MPKHAKARFCLRHQTGNSFHWVASAFAVLASLGRRSWQAKTTSIQILPTPGSNTRPQRRWVVKGHESPPVEAWRPHPAEGRNRGRNGRGRGSDRPRLPVAQGPDGVCPESPALVASCFYSCMARSPVRSVLAPSSDARSPVRSVLLPSSDATL